MPRAIADERGCGTRVDGGAYLEVGMSPDGLPLEHFLIDPAMPIPGNYTAKDLANKTRFIEIKGINHIVSWVGGNHYPHLFDFIEEVRRLGVSRRIPRNLDFSLISDETRLIMVHPRAINEKWEEYERPKYCGKHIPGHADHTTGACIYATKNLIPATDGIHVDEALNTFERIIGSTKYHYYPTGEQAPLLPGMFAVFRPTGLCVVRRQQTANTAAMLARMQQNKAKNIEVFETDK